MHVPHEVRRALGPNHHLAAVLALPARQIGEDRVVLAGREIRHAGATPGRNQEVAVERDGALFRRPLRQALQLGTIALGRRGLDDEIEPLRAQPAQRRNRVLERAFAVPEIVVVARTE